MFNLLFAAMLLIRFWLLDLKPPHHDETINGWFVSQMWQTGSFHYDPTNYHGPLLFWLFQAAEAIGGWGVASFRFVTVTFSVMTCWWLVTWAQRRFKLSPWWILALTFSPGFLFFSRSGIHESIFVFFTIWAATAWIDIWCLKKPEKVLSFLYGLTGALLLKETFIFPLAIGGFLTLPILLRKENWTQILQIRRQWMPHVGICVALWFLLFTGFLQNPKGAFDFFAAFLPWMQTGTAGHGHEKPFWYFWSLIWQYEPATVVAGAVAAVGLAKKGWPRGVALWALGILLAYSFVPYKTPWCLISLQLPIWLAAATTLATMKIQQRLYASILVGFAGLISVSHWYELNFTRYTAPHPYIYVQTSYQAKDFVEGIMKQLQEHPEVRSVQVQWATGESWPFPWWLSIFPHQLSQPLASGIVPNADLVLVDADVADKAQTQLKGSFYKKMFKVRDARIEAVAFLRKDVFTCPMGTCDEVSQ